MYKNLFILGAGCLALLGVFLLFFNGSARGRADYAWVNGTEPETLDPGLMTGQPEGDIAVALFEGLTTYHPRTLEPIPGVAKSWSQEGLTLTFHLRPDHWWVKGDEIFTVDGVPRRVTAHDFVYAWRRHCLPEVGSQYSFLLDSIVGIPEYKTRVAEHWTSLVRDVESKGGTPPLRPNDLGPDQAREVEEFRAKLWNEIVGVQAVDDLTLSLRFQSFVPYFLQITSFYPLYPVPREVIEEYRDEWILPRNIVTNGPYVLDDWRFNAFVRLRKNTHYWETESYAAERTKELSRKEELTPTEKSELELLTTLGSFEKRGLGVLDALAIEKEDTALNLYINGDVDKVRSLPTQIVGELLDENERHPNPHVHHSINPTIYYFDVNLKLPIFQDAETGRKLRRALALAIDRKRLIREVTRAHQVPAYSLVADFVLGYHSEPRFGTGDFTADVAEARRLVEEVRAAGITLPTLRILYNTLESHKVIAAFIQDQWKRNLGIDVRLENQEWQVYLNSRRTGQFDLARGAWIPDYSDPNTFLEMFTSNDLESDRNPERLQQPIIFNQQNHPKYNNPHYNRILLEYSTRTNEFVATPEGRQKLLDDIRSWPSFPQAIESVVRRTGTTSIDDLTEVLSHDGELKTPEEKFEASARARLLLLEIAEQMLMWDMPILPLYHYTMTELWPPELEGIWMNERDVHPQRFLRWTMDHRPVGTRYDDFPRLWPTLTKRAEP